MVYPWSSMDIGIRRQIRVKVKAATAISSSALSSFSTAARLFSWRSSSCCYCYFFWLFVLSLLFVVPFSSSFTLNGAAPAVCLHYHDYYQFHADQRYQKESQLVPSRRVRSVPIFGTKHLFVLQSTQTNDDTTSCTSTTDRSSSSKDLSSKRMDGETSRTAEIAKIPRILFETDRLLVIDKPEGIPHHSTTSIVGSSSQQHVHARLEGDDDGELAVGEFSYEAIVDDVESVDQVATNVVVGEEGILALIRRLQKEKELQPQTSVSSWTSNYTGRLYGVHRLDRVTSGILVLAKDADMAKRLTYAFRQSSASSRGSQGGDQQQQRVVKYYTGVSCSSASAGKNKKKQGWVQGGMKRGRRKSWLLTRDSKGNSSSNFAKTRFFTKGLGHIPYHENGNGLDDENDMQHSTIGEIRRKQKLTAVEEKQGTDSIAKQQRPRTLLLFRPFTGKTHQLRVAAKSIGLPLAGDPIYSGGGGGGNNNNKGGIASRTFLHATALYIPATTKRTTKSCTVVENAAASSNSRKELIDEKRVHDNGNGDDESFKQDLSYFPEDLIVFCPPSFEKDIWNNNEINADRFVCNEKLDEEQQEQEKQARKQLQTSFYELFQKGCDCEPLLQLAAASAAVAASK